MGYRTLEGFIFSGTGAEYYKSLPDIESRIRTVFEGTTELSAGTAIGSLAQGEYYADYENERLYLRTTDDSNPNIKSISLYTFYLAFGTWGTQTEMTNLELFQTFTPTNNSYIKYIKAFVIKYGNPSFTGLKIDIHPELNNYPTAKVLATPENTFTNSEISSNQNDISEIYFKFDDYAVKATEKYCLVLKATGTFSDSAHISWAKMEPIYTTGLTLDTNLIAQGPYRYSIIGRDV